MAITTSKKWLTVTGDVGGTGVKHQYKITYGSGETGDTVTPAFDWAVMGDFTVTLSAHDHATSASENALQNWDMEVQGSVDGDNYVNLIDTDGDNTLASGSKAGVFIYDFDHKGLMPHMRISLGPDAGITQAVWVTVTPHHMV